MSAPTLAHPPAERRYDLRVKADRDRFTAVETDRALAGQIRALRLSRGWSQAELARRAGLRQPQISALENGISVRCRLATLARIAHACDVGLAARFAPWSSVTGLTPADLAVPSCEGELQP